MQHSTLMAAQPLQGCWLKERLHGFSQSDIQIDLEQLCIDWQYVLITGKESNKHPPRSQLSWLVIPLQCFLITCWPIFIHLCSAQCSSKHQQGNIYSKYKRPNSPPTNIYIGPDLNELPAIWAKEYSFWDGNPLYILYTTFTSGISSLLLLEFNHNVFYSYRTVVFRQRNTKSTKTVLFVAIQNTITTGTT